MHLKPEEDLVVHDLQPLLDHVSRIMESAFDEVVTYYKQKKRPVNIQTLPDIVRDEAKHFLEEYSLPEQPYVLEDLARNGLSLLCHGSYYQMYHIKILKSSFRDLLIARLSRRKEQFLCQLPLAFAQLELPVNKTPSVILPFRSRTSTSRMILNLVFAWNVDFKQGMLRLALVCPKHIETNQAVIYWEHHIEHAALRIAKEQPLPTYVDGVDDPDEYGISLSSLGELGNGLEDD